MYNLSIYQFLRYSLVGAVGTTLHFLGLFCMVNWLAAPPVAASLAGALIGTICNSALNHRLVFACKQRYARTAPRYFVVAALGIALNTISMDQLINRMLVHYIAAQIITTTLVLSIGYCLNALWTFGGSSGAE